MTVLSEILEWSTKLAPWQSDAVARLIKKGQITPEDEAEIYQLMLQEHKLIDTGELKPEPLTAADIPAELDTKDTITLLEIKNLEGVNAIAEGQSITFSTGLTVIYGDNGVGKSGYSRVFKKACRARDRNEEVLSNANLPQDKAKNPKATFDLLINDQLVSVEWNRGTEAPKQLSAFTVFDTLCATEYLLKKDDYSYIPHGIGIFSPLANLFDTLKGYAERDKLTFAYNSTAFQHLIAPTKVGQLIQRLPNQVTIQEIEELAGLSKEERIELEHLTSALQENDPVSKIQLLNSYTNRLLALTDAIRNEISVFNEVNTPPTNTLIGEFINLQNAASKASDALRKSNNYKAQISSAEWLHLFEAASAYAKHVNPQKEFPHYEKEDSCPLCQQPLGDSLPFLINFDTFIKGQLNDKLKATESHIQETISKLEKLNKILFEDTLLEEIKTSNLELFELIINFKNQFETDLSAIIKSLNSKEISAHTASFISPVEKLDEYLKQLRDQLSELNNSANSEKRQIQISRKSELDARLKFADAKDLAIDSVKNFEIYNAYEKCIATLGTKPISQKAAELTRKAVSGELLKRLEIEFNKLDVGNLGVSLDTRVERGKTEHQLKINLTQGGKPTQILSEGEQRAIALASFFAEVNLDKNRRGIIFDDPVSSLDHKRRNQVAQRIAAEARVRQVIVFTHDIYFLNILLENAERFGTNAECRNLVKNSTGTGIAQSDLPFEVQGTKKRIRSMKKISQDIKTLYKAGDEEAYKEAIYDAFTDLRKVWERAVEEILLCGVVLRFRKSVETSRLKGLVVDSTDFTTVTDGMTFCSNYAHDNAERANQPIPTPEQFEYYVNMLDTWVSNVLSRSEKAEAERKLLPTAHQNEIDRLLATE